MVKVISSGFVISADKHLTLDPDESLELLGLRVTAKKPRKPRKFIVEDFVKW